MPLLILAIPLAIALIFGLFRTYQVQNAPEQTDFLAGKIPTKSPEGKYKGTVEKLKTNWIGKSFNAQQSSGINNFKENNHIVEKYPFKTYTGQGIQDKNKEIFKIDYNLPQNPLWLRFILDEIVQTHPNKFLGKVHIRLLPGLAFTMGYFKLEQQQLLPSTISLYHKASP
jgi:hypothetical protein